MKKRLLASILMLAGMFILGCDRDEDGRINPVEAFSGTWLCRETVGEFAPQTYPIQINIVSGNDVEIINLYNRGVDFVVAARVQNRQLLISKQSVGNKQIEGEGLANPRFTQVELVFSVTEGGIRDDVQAVLIK
jgi:hypothetical protein